MGRRQTTRKTIAYISCAQTKKIIIFELLIEEEQAFLIDQASVTGPDGPSVTSMPLAVHPTRKFLYAAVRSAPYPVSSYAINPSDGRLSVLSTTPLPDNMAYIRTDLTGKYLLSASYSGANFCLNQIDDNGNVLSPEIQQLSTPPKTHSVIPSSSNRFLYVASLAGDVILQYEFDPAGGAVTPAPVSISTTHAGAGPRHLVLHPNGVYLYVINELGGTITAFRLEARSGIPTAIQTVELLSEAPQAERSAADLHLTPDGRFLYASERNSNTLISFAVDAAGLLTKIETVETEASPRSFAIDPSGCLLVVVGQTSNSMSIYSIDQRSGHLTKKSHHRMAPNPSWIEIIELPWT